MKAFITGGSAGLGHACCDELGKAGWDVVSLDRSDIPSTEHAIHVTCDLADRALLDLSIPAMVAAGPYDLVVLNAGASATGRFEDIPIEAQLRVLRINAEAPMVLASTLVREGAMKNPSAIVFISSLSHFTGYPGAAAYAASKDAIAVYAKSIRRPFARKGISVSVAFPGPLRTAHAERHAPPGADAARRMPADEAAKEIIAGALAGRPAIIPGSASRRFALAGRMFPSLVTAQMRRLVFNRLDGPVW